MLVYLHIPYCDSKCHYCSFNSYVDKFDTRKEYMHSLHQQLVFELKRFNANRGSIKTLFIGGGTPSTIPAELYEPIFKLLKPYLRENAEITAEANPNSATPTWLAGMKKLGVNRISFGVQSFDEAKLKALNRAHSPKQAKEAIHTAKSLGFDHLSLDLIYNYRGDTKALLQKDIEKAFSLPIDHISAYELTIEEGTVFSKNPQARQEDDDLAFFVTEEITQRGFEQYEISNYGKYQSEHNKGYWRLENYIGAGAGAVGFLEDRRFYPQTDIESYINHPLSIAEEILSETQLLTEKIFLGLRSNVGLDQTILTSKMIEKAMFLTDEGKLTLQNGIFYNPNYFLTDSVALYLLD
ncbi:MAG: coproporphyrinogen III oxidase family protein [Campylobacterales bacterium]|nr:coproporphyrinogen III oxidase family protein [Campylobacterales bacterium]